MKTNVAKLNMARDRFRYRSGRRDHVVNLVTGNREEAFAQFSSIECCAGIGDLAIKVMQ